MTLAQKIEYHDSQNCNWCQDGDHVHSPGAVGDHAHVYVGGVDWTMFTKRTGDPKLRWLEGELVKAAIPSRRHGSSFHGPILEVRLVDIDRAWEILDPVDDVEDDHPRFSHVGGVR